MLEPDPNMRYRRVDMKKKEEPLVEGVNIDGDVVKIVEKGQVILIATLEQWHNARWEDLTPLDQIPNSLEEWCDGQPNGRGPRPGDPGLGRRG